MDLRNKMIECAFNFSDFFTGSNSEVLTLSEFKKALKSDKLGLEEHLLDDAMMDALFKYVDEDNTGTIGYREFTAGFLGLNRGKEEAKQKNKPTERRKTVQVQTVEDESLEVSTDSVASKVNQQFRKRPSMAHDNWTHLAELGKMYPRSGGSLYATIDAGFLGTDSPTPITALARGVHLTSGIYFYEVEPLSNGYAVVGWADEDFIADHEDGCGLGATTRGMHSWGYDANAGTHLPQAKNSTNGVTWKVGDVLTVFVNVDVGRIYYELNGSWGSKAWVGFTDVKFSKSLCPAITFDSAFKGRVNIGGTAFRYPPRVRKVRQVFNPYDMGVMSVFHWLCVNVSRIQIFKQLESKTDQAVDYFKTLLKPPAKMEMPAEGLTFPNALMLYGMWYFEFSFNKPKTGTCRLKVTDIEVGKLLLHNTKEDTFTTNEYSWHKSNNFVSGEKAGIKAFDVVGVCYNCEEDYAEITVNGEVIRQMDRIQKNNDFNGHLFSFFVAKAEGDDHDDDGYW